jgi:hypothetical protein
VQQQVLGPLFRHPWPVITPRKADPTKPYERFNFLYSDSRKGEKALKHLLDLLAGDNTSIVINLGLSGAGKTYLLTQLALQRQRYVLFYDCGTNARVIGRIIKDYWESQPTDMPDNKFSQYLKRTIDYWLNPKATLTRYEKFSDYLERVMSNFTLANAYVLRANYPKDKSRRRDKYQR